MTHLRLWFEQYWRALLGSAVWVFFVLSCGLVPTDLTYIYGTVWAGAVVAVTGFFVLGYIRYSKPSKDPVTHKRTWQGEWAWILAQAAIILLIFTYLLFFRVVNETPDITPERAQQYRIGAGIFVTVFFEQLWITWLWTARQINTRRASALVPRRRNPL